MGRTARIHSALPGGALISRDAAGLVQNYWMAAVVGATASLLAIVLGRGLNLKSALAVAKQ